MATITKGNLTEFIREQLKTNEQWAKRALVVIYERQTTDEQNTLSTNHHNNIGFTGADAYILTSLAQFYKRNKYLSEKQMKIVFRRIHKYCRQILDASEESLLIKSYQNENQSSPTR